MSPDMEAAFWQALAGETMQLFGKPVRFAVEWPGGLPYGWTEEEIRKMATERAKVVQRGIGSGWVGQAND